MRTLLFCALLLWPASLRAQDDTELIAEPSASMDDDLKKIREDMERQTEDYDQARAEDARTFSRAMQAQYDTILKGLAEQDAQVRRLALAQWTQYHQSTNKEWVDYSAKGDAMSRVDFEKGEIIIEVLVPMEDVTSGKKKALGELDRKEREKLKVLAEKKVAEQAKEVFTKKDEDKAPVLRDQVKAEGGKPVTENTVKEYAQKTLAPKIVIEDKPVVAKDGKPRLKVKVKVEMVPDHIKVRAKSHQAQVDGLAKKYGLDPALVFAIIHTESYFNPKARSPAPAFGLMQLMIQSGAREAYKFLHDEDKALPPEYLYDPQHNIELGAAYVHMLDRRHFGKVKDAVNRRMLTISAYNCGPGCVRRVLAKRDADSLSNAELEAILMKGLPKETQAYLPHVQGRMDLYRGL
ncbi:MAG: transglycosylase SLT domain-containing protein [Elusimicrobiota bacterium]